MAEKDKHYASICKRYLSGRCSTKFCKFPHGYADLRPSLTGHQEVRDGVQLREKLYRNRSPLRKSPDRQDGKARHTSHEDSSAGKTIDRDVRKRRHSDGLSDYSGGMSDRSSAAKMQIDDQMREMHSEIMLLKNDKRKLQMNLEDKVKEADSLTSEVHELKMQLCKEKEEGERFTTKVKKFIETQNYHLRLEDELKRSQTHLQNMVAQLELDLATRLVFALSDEECELKRSQDELQKLGEQFDLDAKNCLPFAWSDDEREPNPSSHRLRSRIEVQGRSPQVDEDFEVAETDERFQYKDNDEHVDVDGVDEERDEEDVS